MRAVRSEIDCIVNSLWFKDGDTVKIGDEILQVECMKMMIGIQTPIAGVITFRVNATDYVKAGQVMAEIKEVNK